MLIRALCDYAEKQADTGIPEGWQEQGIHYRILLTPEGEIKDIIDVQEEVEISQKNGKKKTVLRPRKAVLPARTQKTAIDSNIIEHRPLYIFGLEYDTDRKCFSADSPKAQKSHAAFVKHETAYFDGLDSPICTAYRKFLEHWNPAEMAAHPALEKIGRNYKGAYFGFALGIDNANLEEDAQFKERYSVNRNTTGAADEETVLSVCGIFGKELPAARIHDKISGFPGGQASGCVLVGMKETAYQSYGKTQSYNSNISEQAMKIYTKTLNALIADKIHHKVIGDLVLVYFAMKTDDAAECELFSLLGLDTNTQTEESQKQDNKRLNDLMLEVCRGEINALPDNGMDEDTLFYIAGLTPNASRICQKFIVRNRFGDIIANLVRHQHDLQIGSNTRQISFSQIEKQLVSPKSTNEKVSPPLMTAIMLAALNGTRYPDGLLSAVIRRVNTDSDEEKNYFIKLNDIRAGIIKACLNRKANKEEIGMVWDETNQNPGYLCGALFAIYEKIQQDAADTKLNRTIKDAYFASACSRPASVFPKLDRLSANHQKKLNDGSKIYYQQLIGNLMNGLDGAFPPILSLDDQGRFIIGYYHMNRRLWTASEKKEDIENV